MEKTPVRQVLAHNLRALMSASKDLRTQEEVAEKAKIAQTGVSQFLRPDNDAAKSPKLTQVEKVAEAFGLATWQLLIDERALGRELAAALMKPPVLDNDKRLIGWAAPQSESELSRLRAENEQLKMRLKKLSMPTAKSKAGRSAQSA